MGVLGQASSAKLESVLERVKESTLEGLLGQREYSRRSPRTMGVLEQTPLAKLVSVLNRIRKSILEGLLRQKESSIKSESVPKWVRESTPEVSSDK